MTKKLSNGISNLSLYPCSPRLLPPDINPTCQFLCLKKATNEPETTKLNSAPKKGQKRKRTEKKLLSQTDIRSVMGKVLQNRDPDNDSSESLSHNNVGGLVTNSDDSSDIIVVHDSNNVKESGKSDDLEDNEVICLENEDLVDDELTKALGNGLTLNVCDLIDTMTLSQLANIMKNNKNKIHFPIKDKCLKGWTEVLSDASGSSSIEDVDFSSETVTSSFRVVSDVKKDFLPLENVEEKENIYKKPGVIDLESRNKNKVRHFSSIENLSSEWDGHREESYAARNKISCNNVEPITVEKTTNELYRPLDVSTSYDHPCNEATTNIAPTSLLLATENSQMEKEEEPKILSAVSHSPDDITMGSVDKDVSLITVTQALAIVSHFKPSEKERPPVNLEVCKEKADVEATTETVDPEEWASHGWVSVSEEHEKSKPDVIGPNSTKNPHVSVFSSNSNKSPVLQMSASQLIRNQEPRASIIPSISEERSTLPVSQFNTSPIFGTWKSWTPAEDKSPSFLSSCPVRSKNNESRARKSLFSANDVQETLSQATFRLLDLESDDDLFAEHEKERDADCETNSLNATQEYEITDCLANSPRPSSPDPLHLNNKSARAVDKSPSPMHNPDKQLHSNKNLIERPSSPVLQCLSQKNDSPVQIVQSFPSSSKTSFPVTATISPRLKVKQTAIVRPFGFEERMDESSGWLEATRGPKTSIVKLLSSSRKKKIPSPIPNPFKKCNAFKPKTKGNTSTVVDTSPKPALDDCLPSAVDTQPKPALEECLSTFDLVPDFFGSSPPEVDLVNSPVEIVRNRTFQQSTPVAPKTKNQDDDGELSDGALEAIRAVEDFEKGRKKDDSGLKDYDAVFNLCSSDDSDVFQNKPIAEKKKLTKKRKKKQVCLLI